MRDLALLLEPQDADLATAARPEEIESLFARTYSVGRAFGTVVVHTGEIDLQVTTFRSEGEYPDARRPAEVRFATSVEDDAARRDFTCNALYLDPLTDEFRDPTGGLEDLGARRLRCVGDAERRFAEDGLRILRLARFAANYGLEVEPATRAAAARSLDALRGVSAERVLYELERLAAGEAPGRGLDLLAELGALERVIPELDALSPEGALLDRRCSAVGALGPSCGTRRFLGALLRPLRTDLVPRAEEYLRALRVPRASLDAIVRAWRLEPELEACLADPAGVRRSRRVRLVRAEEFEDAAAVWRAWHPGERREELAELLEFAGSLGEAGRFPRPFLASADLERAGIPRGARWSKLLREAEDLQLDGTLASPEDARRWLARRAGES